MMLKSERSAFILKHIEQHGSARIRDLAEALQVSEMSIRRDLTELEESGQVRRVRGGAVLGKPATAGVQVPLYVRRIAEAAARLLPEEGTLFLSAGPIALELVSFLPTTGRFTIITNALDIAWQVARRPQYTLHVLGGEVGEDFTIHSEARRFPALAIDWAVIEAGGVDPVRGMTHEHKAIAAIARTALKSAAQKMVVIRPERVGHGSGELIAPVEMLDVLVTGREASSAALWDLSEAGLRFVLA